MATADYAQASFSGGEWSKVSQGRFDLPTYKTAMNVCLNGVPIDTGTWTRRPGECFRATTRNGAPGRVYSFDFEQNVPYNMEFTDGFLRLFGNTQLATTNDDATVASISTANPAVVQTSAAHGWPSTATWQVQFNDLSTLCPILQNRQFVATYVDSTHFSLSDPITGATIDGSTLGWATPGTLPTVSRILELVTPYTAHSWQNLRSVYAEATAIFLVPSVASQVLSVTAEPTSTTFASVSLTPANFIDGPYFDPVAGGAVVTPSGLTGNVTLTLSFPAYDATKSYVKGDFVISSSVNYKSLLDQNLNNTPASSPTYWQAVSAGIAVGPAGFLATDIGRHVRLFSEPPLWNTATSYSTNNVVSFNGSYWTALAGMTGATPSAGNINPNQPGNLLTTWAINSAGATWTWGKIISLSNAISGTLSGIAYIGDLTNGAGLSAAFDGNTSKIQTSGAFVADTLTGGQTVHNYIGANYSGATDQKIGQATIYPSNDHAYTGTAGLAFSLTFNLRGKASAPSSATDGTLLGTTSYAVTVPNPEPNVPITIVSTDQATSWKYVWIEVMIVSGESTTHEWDVAFSQVQFFNPTGTGSGTGVTVQIIGDPLLYTTAIRAWRLGLYSNTTGWPTAGTYHEGRLWLTSAAFKNRFDGSISNVDFKNNRFSFQPTLPAGTVTDKNAISYTFNAKDVSAIYWMEPDHLGIVMGTQAGEWLVQATALNNPLTPTSIQAHRVTKNGCANIEPRRCELTTVFVQRYKHKVLEYFPDVFSGKFSAPNLSVNAKHLTTRGVEEIAYQQELSPVLWSRCSDGSLIGASYKRDSQMSSQGPTFIGWHSHTLGSGRVVESISGGPSKDGLLDTLSMVTNDTSTNVRHVSFLTNFWEETNAITDAWFLDDAVVPTSYSVSTVLGVLSLVCNGLWHLNGKTVSVFAGGVDAGNFTVSNGSVTVPLPSGYNNSGLLTSTFISGFSGAMPIVVGFTYTSRGQLLRPATPETAGTRMGNPLGNTRRSAIVSALLNSTQGISFGTSFLDKIGGTTSMKPAKLMSPGGTTLLAQNQLFSGVLWLPLTDGYTLDSMVAWQITRPVPATVCAIGATVQTQDQ